MCYVNMYQSIHLNCVIHVVFAESLGYSLIILSFFTVWCTINIFKSDIFVDFESSMSKFKVHNTLIILMVIG